MTTHRVRNQEIIEAGNLKPLPATSASPLDLPSETFQAGLDRRKANRASLMVWIRDAMIEGTDYGRIHVVGRSKCQYGKNCKNPDHFSKPSLFKPGAEKICGMLGITVHYPTLPDYEKAALSGAKLAQIIIRCELRDAADRVVADGVGARSLAQDYGDVNKALKMAEKSAHIDATLRMAGLSEVFTQDLEDMAPAAKVEAVPEPVKQAAEFISQSQHKRLEARIKELGLDRDRVKAWLRKASQGRFQNFLDLTPEFYQRLYSKLEDFAERTAMQEEAIQG